MATRTPDMIRRDLATRLATLRRSVEQMRAGGGERAARATAIERAVTEAAPELAALQRELATADAAATAATLLPADLRAATDPAGVERALLELRGIDVATLDKLAGGALLAVAHRHAAPPAAAKAVEPAPVGDVTRATGTALLAEAHRRQQQQRAAGA